MNNVAHILSAFLAAVSGVGGLPPSPSFLSSASRNARRPRPTTPNPTTGGERERP